MHIKKEEIFNSQNGKYLRIVQPRPTNLSIQDTSRVLKERQNQGHKKVNVSNGIRPRIGRHSNGADRRRV